MKDPSGNAAPVGGFQNLGWYSGYQYYNGTFAPQAGMIHPQSPQQGAGQAVSAAVNNQTNPNNNAYIAKQNSQPIQNSQAPIAQPTNVNTTIAATSNSAPTGGGGISGGTGNLGIGGAPTMDIQGITNAAYNTPEITAANKAVTDANTELTTRQQALADAQAGINDNPFYSEATRVGKSQQLTQQAIADMTVIQNKISQAQGQVASLKADAAIKVNAAQGQYNINEQAYKDNLTQFNNLLSAGALDNASGTDIANLAVQTGIPTSMIQSMVSQSQKKDNPVQLIQSTDNAGNLTLLSVDSNGKVLNTTTIAGAGKAATGGTAADTKITEATTNQNNLVQDIKNKVTLKSLVDHYSQVLSIDDIYRLYNQYSPWGAATEDLASVKQGRYADMANSGAKPAIKP